MPLEAYLLLGAALLSIGLWGALSQQSIVMLMMGLELMINGILVSTVAFWRHVSPDEAKGQLFGIIVLLVMAVEMALGFAIVIAVYRARQADTVDAVEDFKG